MKNIHEIKYTFLILNFVFCFTCCNGQNKYNLEYSIGTIPAIDKFEKMTEREIYMDTLMHKHNEESLQRMIDGTAFIEGVSEEDKQEAIEYQKSISQRYKDNRSRYYLELTVNDINDNNYFEDIDTLTTECNCYLSGDTIKVKMGVWIFGGFAFTINLNKDKFNIIYWEDTHKQLIYKSKLTDTVFVDNVYVENEEQALILENKPTFSVGEDILGYLTFKTKNYYRTSYHESGLRKDSYSGEIMDKLNMKGSLYFKCKVRKKTIGDE